MKGKSEKVVRIQSSEEVVEFGRSETVKKKLNSSRKSEKVVKRLGSEQTRQKLERHSEV